MRSKLFRGVERRTTAMPRPGRSYRRFGSVLLALVLGGCTVTQTPAEESAALPAATTAVAPDVPATTAAAATPVATASAAPPNGVTCPDAATPVEGPIVFGAGNTLLAVHPSGAGMAQLFELPETLLASDPAWSPDSAILAYTLSGPATSTDIPGLMVSIICAVDRQTGTGSELARGIAENQSFAEPSWTADGSALFVTVRETQADPTYGYRVDQSVARYDPVTHSSHMVVADSSSPTSSSDGQHLAYIRYDQQTDQALLVFARSDGLEGRLMAETQPPFDLITFPRWSPDSSRLVFAGSGGPTDQASRGSLWHMLFARVAGASVAAAHGLPADLWLIGRDGQGLVNLTERGLDDPRAAWSPDGHQLAYIAGSQTGLYLFDIATREVRQLADQGDYGGITWALR